MSAKRSHQPFKYNSNPIEFIKYNIFRESDVSLASTQLTVEFEAPENVTIVVVHVFVTISRTTSTGLRYLADAY